MASYKHKGVDWSKYQGDSGVWGTSADSFAIAQVGGIYGGSYVTQGTYGPQVASILAKGRHAHTYIWFQVGGSQPQANAGLNKFLPMVKTPKGSIVALDYEAGASSSIANNTAAIIYGMKRVAQAGYKPLLYSYKPYLKAHVNVVAVLKAFPNSLWVAAYPDYKVRTEPLWSNFPSMDGVAIWQFTSTYKVGGLDGNADLLGITTSGYTTKRATAKPATTKKEDDDMPAAKPRDSDVWGIAYLTSDSAVYDDAALTTKVGKPLLKGTAYKAFSAKCGAIQVGGNQWISTANALVRLNPLAPGAKTPGAVVQSLDVWTQKAPGKGQNGIKHLVKGSKWKAFEVSEDGAYVKVGTDQWVALAKVQVLL